jgi:hypothetical protein
VTISSHPLIDLTEVEPDWPDEVVDLTDRRRILVRLLLGRDVTPAQADALFDPSGQSSSTTMRSAGRSSSTDDR